MSFVTQTTQRFSSMCFGSEETCMIVTKHVSETEG